MSELIYCPECGHPKWDKDHSNCTYESLVGEKVDIQQSICPCAEWTGWIGARPPVNFNVNYGHHPNCDGKGGIYDGNLPIFEMNPDAKPAAMDVPELFQSTHDIIQAESVCPVCIQDRIFMQHDLDPSKKTDVGKHVGHCPCTPLLSAKQLTNGMGHHPKCNHKMNTTLQLLVLDMGDVCVVKVEKGEIDLPPHLSSHTAHDDGVPIVADVPFTELRSAIDGEKPHTRLEKNQTEAEYRYKISWRSDTDYENWTTISDGEYDALSKLAGKLLPLYEGGKWDELIALQSKDEYGDWIDKRDFTAWRYTR